MPPCHVVISSAADVACWKMHIQYVATVWQTTTASAGVAFLPRFVWRDTHPDVQMQNELAAFVSGVFVAALVCHGGHKSHTQSGLRRDHNSCCVCLEARIDRVNVIEWELDYAAHCEMWAWPSHDSNVSSYIQQQPWYTSLFAPAPCASPATWLAPQVPSSQMQIGTGLVCRLVTPSSSPPCTTPDPDSSNVAAVHVLSYPLSRLCAPLRSNL